jgi:hypothetical protein
MRTLLACVLALQTLLVASCAGARGGRSASGTSPTVLQVDNQGLADMNIYIFNAGQRFRIGFAGGLRKTQITIPNTLIPGTGELAFLADPVGSNRASVTNRIYVTPGDTVAMIIQP